MSHETQGTGYDPGAAGHESQGRQTSHAEMIEQAAKAVRLLKDARQQIEAAFTDGGLTTDPVRVLLTKEQAATVAVLIDDFLK